MKKLILFGSPLLFMILILIINVVFDLLRQPSDFAVIAGLLLTSALTFLVYVSTIKIIKIFKTK